MKHPGEQNLNTFRILFLIKGILALLIVFLGIFYASLGSFVSGIAREEALQKGEQVPFDPAYIFIIIGGIISLLGLATSISALMASQRLNQKRGRTFIIVAAAINCLTGVLGVILCVFTIIELQKPEVKEVFEANDGN